MWNAADRNVESGYAFSMREQLRKRFHVVDLFSLNFSEDRLWSRCARPTRRQENTTIPCVSP